LIGVGCGAGGDGLCLYEGNEEEEKGHDKRVHHRGVGLGSECGKDARVFVCRRSLRLQMRDFGLGCDAESRAYLFIN